MIPSPQYVDGTGELTCRSTLPGIEVKVFLSRRLGLVGFVRPVFCAGPTTSLSAS